MARNPGKENPHAGHRQRLRERFLRSGLDGFEEHIVLELLLFYAIPQADTNVLAHALIDEFGSLADVFDAPVERLRKVKGIGANAATLIKLIPQISRRYTSSRAGETAILASPESAGRYLLPKFIGERDEIVYAVFLDSRCKVIADKLLFRGGVNSANVNARKIVEAALSCNATGVIIAHNHTNGVALPTREDEIVTRRIRDSLRAVELDLIDHIVVANGDFVSFSDNGFFNE